MSMSLARWDLEWVKLLATQANAVCDESSKKTISPEHVVEALRVGRRCVLKCLSRGGRFVVDWGFVQQLGFEDFVGEVEDSNKDFKQSQKVYIYTYMIVSLLSVWKVFADVLRRSEHGRSRIRMG